MSRSFKYFKVQLKRVMKTFPRQMIVNLLVCLCVGVLMVVFIRDGLSAQDGQKYRIGVVGDMSDSYLGFGITALQSIDDSRFMIELVTMTREEARTAFEKGELYAIVQIPEGMMEAIESGANDKRISYIAAEGQKGIGTMVMGQIVDVASTLVTRSQSAVFGMQSIMLEHGMQEEFWEATNALNLLLIELVVNRSGLYDVEVLGIANGLSIEGYYFCGILLFLLLLAGINNSPLFTRRQTDMPRFMQSRGVGAAGQVAGEYVAYLCLMILCVVVIFIPLYLCLEREWFTIPEWEGMGAEPLTQFLPALLPVTAMFAALQFLLYEIMAGVVSGILLQFLCGIGMGYLSGFFYPAAFFPDIMQRLGRIMPTGAALRYVNGSVAKEESGMAGFGVLLYLAVFLVLSVYVRRSRIRRG